MGISFKKARDFGNAKSKIVNPIKNPTKMKSRGGMLKFRKNSLNVNMETMNIQAKSKVRVIDGVKFFFPGAAEFTA